jgi:hypothetical protein
MAYSQLPGRTDGPADAYRHLLLSAELTRRFGEAYARTALDFHEWDGNRLGQSTEANTMDVHNNELGIALGKGLASDPNASWHDVVEGSRRLMDAGVRGDPAAAMWMGKEHWRVNPKPDEGGPRMSNDDPRLNWPPTWPDGPYQNPAGRDAGEPYMDDIEAAKDREERNRDLNDILPHPLM